jgi:transcriptional regulator with XRE-family HTH domain
MPKDVLITPTMLYIVKKVRTIRLELGLSQRDVSKIINPDTDSNLLGGIESPKHADAYTDHALNKLAIGFTARANEIFREYDTAESNSIESKFDYTIHDFYPVEKLDDNLIPKTIEPIPKDMGPVGTLNAILETSDFLVYPRTPKEVVAFANSITGKSWKDSDYNSTLDTAYRKGKLKRINTDALKYQKK